ncbi:MAG: hypothetical protein H6838_01795 [Planctomycetes bacterium]|nr:hypothetical protein [Planctomycetota bacterium]
MRKITVETARRIAGSSVGAGRTRELSLVEFLRAGDSFRICAAAHRWPPLATFDAFLQCGVDDDGDDTLHWRPFAIDDADYVAARAEVDPEGQVDALGASDGDWRTWFSAAVERLAARSQPRGSDRS